MLWFKYTLKKKDQKINVISNVLLEQLEVLLNEKFCNFKIRMGLHSVTALF